MLETQDFLISTNAICGCHLPEYLVKKGNQYLNSKNRYVTIINSSWGTEYNMPNPCQLFFIHAAGDGRVVGSVLAEEKRDQLPKYILIKHNIMEVYKM